jgi:tetratricopeptide (TPR) repeat protein
MTSITKLADKAMQAAQSGQPHEAATLYKQILERDPKHDQSLFYLAHYALQTGQSQWALQFAARFAAVMPNHADGRRLLGETLEINGDLVRAEEQYRAALTLQPGTAMLFVHLATLYAAQGQVGKAAMAASFAFEADPSLPALIHEQRVDPSARERIRSAKLLLNQVLSADHRVRAAGAPRIVEAIWPATHDKLFDFPSEAQRPWLLYTPGLPNRVEHELAWLSPFVQDGLPLIEEVVEHLNVAKDGESLAQRRLGQAPASLDWRALHLWRGGAPQSDVQARFPKLSAALDALPLAKIGGATGIAYVMILGGDQEVPRHHGQSNAHATVLLPLMGLGGELRLPDKDIALLPGSAVVFDDSFLHGYRNNAAEPLVALVMQAYHPDLNAEEIAALERALDGRAQWLEARTL